VDSRGGRQLRWLRATLLASVVLAFGTAAHQSAEGLLPGPIGMLLLAGLCLVGSAVALSGPASALRLVVLTAGGQAVVHVFLTLTAGHRGDGAASHVVARPLDDAAGGSLMDAYAASQPLVADSTGDPLAHLIADLSGHAPMMAAHLAAAAVVGLWLALGERALWALVALASAGLTALVVRFGRSVLLPPSLGPVPAPVAPPPPALVHLARTVVRRGPPALLAA